MSADLDLEPIFAECRARLAATRARKKAAEDTKKAKETGGSLEEIFGKEKDVKMILDNIEKVGTMYRAQIIMEYPTRMVEPRVPT